MMPSKTLEEAKLVIQRELTCLEKLWFDYSATKSNYFLYAHTYMFLIIFCTLILLPLSFLELKGLNKYKIQQSPKISPHEIFKCYKQIVLVFVLLGGPLSIISYPFIEWIGIRTDMSLPSACEFFSQLLVYFIVDDYGVYWIHRWFHCKWWYENIHKVHHEFTAPIALVSAYSHWADILVMAVPSFVGPAMVPCHMITFWFWNIIRLLEATITHSGYDIPWCPTKYIPFYGGVKHHDYHHFIGGQSRNNFASVFTYCDHIYGTNKGYLYYLRSRN